MIRFAPKYSPAQHHILFESDAKFRIHPKGRRFGMTRGAAHAYIEWMLEGRQLLWGDTILANIRRYVERYFEPALKADSIPYTWNLTEKILRVGQGFTDFRSADHPENWEGFGYHVIFLNEAGIILEGEKGQGMFQNSVMPMLADFPDSTLIAAGVPKGKNLFHTLHQQAVGGAPGYHHRTFTSYDNPFLSRASLRDLEAQMLRLGGRLLVDQEIYGKFVDATSDAMRVIPRPWVEAAMQRWRERQPPEGFPDVAGLDVARGGDDATACAPRKRNYFWRVRQVPGSATPDGPTAAAFALQEVGPDTRLNVDVIGVGASAYDHLLGQRKAGTVVAVNAAEGTDEMDRTGTLAFRNVRALMWWRMREALDPANGHDLALPPDDELLEDLIAPTWKLTAQGIQIESKDDIRKRLGRSTNVGDAVVQTEYSPPEGGDFFIDSF
ncbi:hypothetical protein DEIPH_ctg017orf0231 [Deinococcus phoenicis]|uniref:Terminase large subunit gp17-like C-terminal domain-containing protein n=1 Tax=Deinococcus phoenicis TaxID=1476583 RepID=A0A016QS08_9DEIO|nr:hypothetical protein [Deinococcus phoenicis]EYB68853.1 hypothetical protein DEIPH_ctg017orf0231 [Deinococcus phoenicis]